MKRKGLLIASASLMMSLAGCGQSHVNVGLLYCSAEANSKYQVNVVKAELESKGLSVKEISFSDSNDLQSVLSGSIGSVDTIYIPTDNTCASSAPIINKIVRDKKVPVFAGEEGICEGCGAITLSISYYNIGYKTGEMAVDILINKTNPGTMEIAYDENPVKKFNKDFCEALNISVPSDYVEIGKDSGSSKPAKIDNQNPNNLKFTIGIAQIVDHPALNLATEGFKDAVKDGLGEANVTFDYQDAANNLENCSTIVNSFVNKRYDLIMANATPVLQAAANATKTIPVLGTSITEYGVALNIPDFKGKTGTNVSGTSDLAPLKEQANMLAEVFASYMSK